MAHLDPRFISGWEVERLPAQPVGRSAFSEGWGAGRQPPRPPAGTAPPAKSSTHDSPQSSSPQQVPPRLHVHGPFLPCLAPARLPGFQTVGLLALPSPTWNSLVLPRLLCLASCCPSVRLPVQNLLRQHPPATFRSPSETAYLCGSPSHAGWCLLCHPTRPPCPYLPMYPHS